MQGLWGLTFHGVLHYNGVLLSRLYSRDGFGFIWIRIHLDSDSRCMDSDPDSICPDSDITGVHHGAQGVYQL